MFRNIISSILIIIALYGCEEKEVAQPEVVNKTIPAIANPNAEVDNTPPAPKKQIEETLSTPLNSIKQYLAYTPKGYKEKSTNKWPLVIFLHGSGEKGTEIAKVKVNGLPRYAEAIATDYPFIMISPQLLNNVGDWNTNDLDKLLEEILTKYNVDLNRIVVTGLSLGGGGAWAWATNSPQHFAAALPICGWGTPTKACQMKNVAVWAFHGDADYTVGISGSTNMVEALQRCGASPKYTIYQGVGHDSWTRTYTNPEVIDWIIAQKKGG